MGSDPRAELTEYIRTKHLQPNTVVAMGELVSQLEKEVSHYREYKDVPAQDQANVRNDMYVVSESLGMMAKARNPAFTPTNGRP